MWYQSKIAYSVRDDEGKSKRMSESFLHDAFTYGEVEKQMAEFLEGRVSDYTYTIVPVKFNAVYDSFVKGDFYKVMIEEETMNLTGDVKKQTYAHLVVAGDVTEAEARATEYMKNWVVDTTIIGADKTKIVGVWHPNMEQWKDDFKQRMLVLAEEGAENKDSAQTSLFNADGSVRKVEINGKTIGGSAEDETSGPDLTSEEVEGLGLAQPLQKRRSKTTS